MSEGDRRETMDKKAIAALAAASRPLPPSAEFKRDGLGSGGGSGAGGVVARHSGLQNVARCDSGPPSGGRREYGARPYDFGGAKKYPQSIGGKGNKGFSGNGGKKPRLPDEPDRGRGASTVNQSEEVAQAEGVADSWYDTPDYDSIEPWRDHKKSSHSHLLNFHYATHSTNHSLTHSPHHGARRGVGARGGYGSQRKGGAYRGGGGAYRGGGGAGAGHVFYNKERFLQANCQFVVRGGADYSLHVTDPDTLVNWDLVEQVRILSYEVQSCPICLYPPRAAKMTRCGHVYCWACMLHYMSLDDRKWSKCPICYESVHEKDLKSVVALDACTYSVGDQICMRLMKKARGEIRVAPRAEWRPSTGQPCGLQDASLVAYAKLLAADCEQVESILKGERVALEQQLQEEGENTLEGSFVMAALKSLKEREDRSRLVVTLHQKGVLVLGNHSMERMTTSSAELQPVGEGGKQPAPLAAVKVERRPVRQYVSAFSDDEAELEQNCTDTAKQAESAVAVSSTSSAKSAATAAANDVAATSAAVANTFEGHEMEQLIEGTFPCPVSHSSDANDASATSTVSPGPIINGGTVSTPLACESTNESSGAVAGTQDGAGVLVKAGLVEAEHAGIEMGNAGISEESVTLTSGRSDLIADESGAFYFYQATDGQHIYMHPLNVRCLKRQYGSLALAPDCVTATILELEPFSMDEDVRRRLRVLNHLPLTCQFVTAELDLLPPTLHADVRDEFADEMDGRRKDREWRARDDRQRARRIQDEENRKMGIDPTVRVIRSDYRSAKSAGPSLPPVSTPPTPPVPCPGPAQWEGEEGGVSPPPVPSSVESGWGSEEGRPSSTLSFAQMLKAGHQRLPPPCRADKPPLVSVGMGKVRRGSGGEEDCEGGGVPSYGDSWACDIQAALDSLEQQRGAEKEADDAGMSGGGGKKKKKVKKLLFTNSMARHN